MLRVDGESIMRASACCALALLPLAAHTQEVIHPGYAWHEAGDGVFVHTQIDPLAGPVDGNSIVIVGDTGIVVVDTHINPAVARSVIGKIRAMSNVPVTHVINTHWHDDHTNGNHEYRKAYPDVRIIAHRATLESLREEWQAMEDGRREAYASIDVERLRAAADVADDPGTAISYRVYAGYVEALRPELPGLVLEYPDMVIDDSLSLDIGGRDVELRWLGKGNTAGDVVVWLPGQKIAITGDILVAPIPYAFDSPMVDWSATLGAIQALGAGTVIPGHGPIQRDDAYVAQVRDLIDDTLDAVRSARENGAGYAELADSVDLSEHAARFTGDDPERAYAWSAYFVNPGLKSAWISLGYPVPAEDPG